MRSPQTTRVPAALFLAGGFHSHAGVSEPKAPKNPPAIHVESWDGAKWITTRQVWDETGQRYRVAA